MDSAAQGPTVASRRGVGALRARALLAAPVLLFEGQRDGGQQQLVPGQRAIARRATAPLRQRLQPGARCARKWNARRR
eukprot:9215640-Pyramimonas_sp.AAC.1